MNAILRLLICSAIFWAHSPTDSRAGNTDWETMMFTANQAYKEGRYQDAVDGYRRVLQLGHYNGHLYYNLANAYFRLNDIGPAILFYERARLFIPRDADLNFNRSHANDQTRDAPAESRDFLTSTFFWLDGLTVTDLFRAFAIINGLFFAILIIRLFSKAEWTYYVLFILIFLEVIAAGSFGLKWYQIHTDRRAVILQEEVDIYAGPDSQDTVLFKLHAGSIVKYERSEGEWSLIRLSKEKRGWVRSRNIECILCNFKTKQEQPA